MAGILINPKAEVVRLSSSGFRGLPLWGSCYDITVDVCKVTESHPNKDSDVLRRVAKTALDLPLGLAKTTSYRLGRAYITNLRRTYIQAKQLDALLLLSYELDYLSPERFTSIHAKTGRFLKELKTYISICQGKLKKREVFQKR